MSLSLIALMILFVSPLVLPYSLTGLTWVEKLIFLFVTIMVGFAGWYVELHQSMRTRFWQQFANSNGWTYGGLVDLRNEHAMFFTRGDNPRTQHLITGDCAGHPARIFEFRYTTGSGKTRNDHLYTVFTIAFEGTFPHLYLDYTKDFARSGGFLMPKVALPTEMEKQFALYVPHQYEIEALHVFTPDTLTHLLDSGWKHDLELLDGELLILRKGIVGGLFELESEYQKIQAFVEHLAPKLNRMQLALIGDHSPSLKG